jgi:hypothetical protein
VKESGAQDQTQRGGCFLASSASSCSRFCCSASCLRCSASFYRKMSMDTNTVRLSRSLTVLRPCTVLRIESRVDSEKSVT